MLLCVVLWSSISLHEYILHYLPGLLYWIFGLSLGFGCYNESNHHGQSCVSLLVDTSLHFYWAWT